MNLLKGAEVTVCLSVGVSKAIVEALSSLAHSHCRMCLVCIRFEQDDLQSCRIVTSSRQVCLQTGCAYCTDEQEAAEISAQHGTMVQITNNQNGTLVTC